MAGAQDVREQQVASRGFLPTNQMRWGTNRKVVRDRRDGGYVDVMDDAMEPGLSVRIRGCQPLRGLTGDRNRHKL